MFQEPNLVAILQECGSILQKKRISTHRYGEVEVYFFSPPHSTSPYRYMVCRAKIQDFSSDEYGYWIAAIDPGDNENGKATNYLVPEHPLEGTESVTTPLIEHEGPMWDMLKKIPLVMAFKSCIEDWEKRQKDFKSNAAVRSLRAESLSIPSDLQAELGRVKNSGASADAFLPSPLPNPDSKRVDWSAPGLSKPEEEGGFFDEEDFQTELKKRPTENFEIRF